MAGLPPGDPQLVSMIVSHLKTQGLFDQFRRDCLADVDTKPAYLNLKQRVDNFVSNHLSNHTWSPHLNKNQLRNNIRQLVLQSGMLEQGVDRIVAQVVDPKINHIFRPQVERVAREFLSPGSCSEEPPAPPPPTEPKPESSTIEQVTSSTPATTSASDAMSILDTITTLNQEASVRASSSTEKVRKGQTSDEPSQLQLEEGVQDMKVVEEGDSSSSSDRKTEEGVQELTSEVKMEESQDQLDLGRESLAEEVKLEEEKSGGQEPIEEDKDKAVGKPAGKPEEEHTDDMLKSACQAKQKAKERIKEEYFLEDSDLEGLSDITVSSVHTSDLSSLEGQSDDDQQQSDSSEEGELPPDDQDEKEKKQGEEHKPRRKAYVHKPFLYSRYYSDSDDEVTVEERRRSAAKDKEERLLKRQKNRERMEEQHKQRSVWTEDQDYKKQKGGICFGQEHPKAKQARKERKVLEKKMALNRKRKLGSKKEEDLVKKKVDTDGSRKDAESSRKDAEGSRKDSEGSRKDAEGSRKDVEGPKKDAEGSKKVEVKPAFPKFPQPKLGRNLSESGSSDERHRRTSGSFSEDLSEAKKLSDKSRTHSFILDLEQGSQEALKQRSVGKFDRLFRKEHPKERKERSLSDERTKLKQKQEKKYEVQPDESQQREGTVKMSCEEKVEKKLKIKSEKKIPGKATVSEGAADDASKDASVKKTKALTMEAVKPEKEKEKNREKEKDKDKSKEKEKLKGEKASISKHSLRPDSTGSSEERSDVDPGTDGSKKKEKHSKEALKRSRSHTEDKQGDKPKSKDSEKEKTKGDQDGQKIIKPSSDSDKDQKRMKLSEKRILEKSKLKSKDDTKPQLSKMDNKVQVSEVKSAGGPTVSKPEKKKEGNTKEQRKVFEESLNEKAELSGPKKKAEKKEKSQERRSDSQEERRAPREEKPEKAGKSKTDMEEDLKKVSVLRDASTESDAVTTTVATSFSEDTCDALSDITPEPPEGDTESRLRELPAVPAEADALLTLMDVCTSAEARLPPESSREDVTSDLTLQEADMKMKEAALTLLSMDSAVTTSLICHNAREEVELYHREPEVVESTSAKAEQRPADVLATGETKPVESQQTVEVGAENTNKPGLPEHVQEEDKPSESITQPDEPTSNEQEAVLNEGEAKDVEIPPESQLRDETAAAEWQEAADTVGSETTEVSTDQIIPAESEPSTETSSQKEQPETEIADPRSNPGTESSVFGKQTEIDIDNSEAERKEPETETPEVELVPETNEENRERGPDNHSEQVKQTNLDDVSSTDNQEDKDLSEKEETRDGGGGGRKRKLSAHKAEKESGDEGEKEDTKDEQNTEIKRPCRGQSSGSSEGVKEQHEEPEVLEESLSSGASGAADKEGRIKSDVTINFHKCSVFGSVFSNFTNVSPDAQKEDKDEDNIEKTSSKTADEENTDEERGPKNVEQGGEEALLPAVVDGREAAGSCDPKETPDTPAASEAKEEPEETAMETPTKEQEVKKSDGQQDQSEQLKQRPEDPVSGSQEMVKEEAEKKPDAEADQTQEATEVTPKRPGRRGRPPKAATVAAAAAAAAAAADDPDKKDKRAEAKESEQRGEQEAEEEEGEKGTATRATTRSASRLEAERNKPSKPSTRASRQNGKEETAAGTRGTRGQATAAAAVAAVKGGRKRDASPPAVRTRGGQKSEEAPSKRAKR